MPEIFPISEKNLASYGSLAKEISPLLTGEKSEVFLKPPLLETKEYSIQITCSENTLQKKPLIKGLAFNCELIDDNTQVAIPLIYFQTFYSLAYDGEDLQSITGKGTYLNGTKGKEREFKGIAALFSPVEDAISQAIADVYQLPVKNAQETPVPVIKELFRRRGFEKVGQRGNKEDWMKVFTPANAL